MKKALAIKLRAKADEIAFNFSRKNREGNKHAQETFAVNDIKPLSESTALIEFKKDSGKVGLALAYHINQGGGKWNYFFPTYDHCVGMEQVRTELLTAEQKNFSKNFNS